MAVQPFENANSSSFRFRKGSSKGNVKEAEEGGKSSLAKHLWKEYKKQVKNDRESKKYRHAHR